MIDKTKEEIQNFYLTHSNSETADFLGISKSQMLRILSKLQIEKKVPFKKHTAVKETVTELKNRIDVQNFQADCQLLTQKQMCIKYNITLRQLNYLKEDLNIGNRLKYIKDYDIDKLELETYYKSHTLQDTAQHFGLNSSANIKNLLKYHNIKPEKRIKETFEEAVARINKNDLAAYYKTHTLAETQVYFDCKLIQKLLQYYEIPCKTKKHETFNDVVARIKQDKFIDDFDKLNIYEIFKKYDIAYTTYRKLIQYYGLGHKPGIFAFQDASLSTCEDSLYEFLCTIMKKENIIQHDRNILNGQELDFYIPAKKLAIEFNGNYWHSDLKKEKNYHFNKSKLADSKGIRLIHIWEYEWNDPTIRKKLEQLLKIAAGVVQKKIYARQCKIQQISNREAKAFNEQTHLQGHRNAQITYGLFFKGELVQLMSFSKTKYNRNLKSENDWEIIRGCPGSNNIIVGGVSKLMSHFIKDYHPNKIFSYCDFNKFNGKSYEAAHMQFVGFTGPDLKYMLQDGYVVNRSPKNYKYNNEHCQFRLFGAGSKKYELILKQS